MYLKHIYTSPETFKKVTFRNGINIIYWKKNTLNNKQEPTNNIGKSTFLDLIDFCLCAHFDERTSKRLFSALKSWILEKTSVFLELDIWKDNFIIERNFSESNTIKIKINEDDFTEYSLKNAKDILLFKSFEEASKGNMSYKDIWFRSLMRFFLKISKKWVLSFDDPIKYDGNLELFKLIPIHLYLMNISNLLAIDNADLQSSKKDNNELSIWLVKFLKGKYGSNFVESAEAHKNDLEIKIKKNKKQLENFKLLWTYESISDDISNLTQEIKDIWYRITINQERIKKYKESLFLTDFSDISPTKISRIYAESNELLWWNIKKTLEDAINFRKTIMSSRKEFLDSEIHLLESSLPPLERQIEKLEEQRSGLYKVINNSDWIKDLVSWYNQVEIKIQELSLIESRLTNYYDIQEKELDIKVKEINLDAQIIKSKEQINNSQRPFLEVISDIYTFLYPNETPSGLFSVTSDTNTVEKISINVLPNQNLWKWRNNWRTLLYDLSILVFRGIYNLWWPKFIIHDWIFDGMDKAQMLRAFRYIEDIVKEWHAIQYITTINEEGDIWEKFGDKEDLHIFKNINDYVILELTPSKKLFWAKF